VPSTIGVGGHTQLATEPIPARTLLSGGRLSPLADTITDHFNQGLDIGITYLLGLLPSLAVLILAIIALLLCGDISPIPEVTVGFPTAAVVGAYTLDDLQVAQVPDGQQIDIGLSNVGMLSEMIVEVSLGSCGDEIDDAEIYFWYPDIDYRATVQFLPGGGTQVDVAVQGALPSIDKLFDGSSGTEGDFLWSQANIAINGANLEDKLIEFATVDVPASLKVFLETNWIPYVAQPGWLVDLSGNKQNVRYSENQVQGNVSGANYMPLESDTNANKYQLVFTNTHSAVTSDPVAVCADGSAFDPGPFATPDWAIENPTAEGTYHTSFKTSEHRILAAIRAGVGTRDRDKPGSPHIVDYGFGELVPEASVFDMTYLLTHIDSPIGPDIPLSSAQISDLLGTGTLATEALSGLRLKIEICETSKPVSLAPYVPGSGSGFGMITHDALLIATIEKGNVPLLTEVYRTNFDGRLHLSKTPREDSLGLQTVRADLNFLETRSIPNIPYDQIDETTNFSAAPVSLFLRGIFGEPNRPAGQFEPRVRFAIEGLAGPLVERSAHSMVVLPGLDFPSFDGPKQFVIQSALEYHADEFTIGLEFNRKALCAEIVAWGSTPAIVGGGSSQADNMLTVEIDWRKVNPPNPMMKTRTSVGVGIVAAPMSPQVIQNPSRFDGGHLIASYGPSNGDETRVINMTGDRFGAYLPDGGTHYAAATPAGYTAMRMGNTDPNATFELHPYKGGPTGTPCSDLFPGPVRDPATMHEGEHHEDAMYTDVYTALTFDSRKCCKGTGRCDGARVVAMWNAPLFQECSGPDGPFAQDEYTFESNLGSLRVPPDSYTYQVQNCDGGSRPPATGIGPNPFDD